MINVKNLKKHIKNEKLRNLEKSIINTAMLDMNHLNLESLTYEQKDLLIKAGYKVTLEKDEYIKFGTYYSNLYYKISWE